MRFLVDMPLSVSLAAWLRDQGHNALHAVETNLAVAPDTAVLARAKEDDRIIVTADLDYPRLLALAQERDCGLILFRDGNWSEVAVIERVRDLLRGLTEADLARSIIVVEHGRIRRRPLPIGPGSN